MDKTKKRTITLLDALILVAATAIGLAWSIDSERSLELRHRVPDPFTDIPELPEDVDDPFAPSEPRPLTPVAPAKATPRAASPRPRALWSTLFNLLSLKGLKFFRYLSLFLVVWTIAFCLTRAKQPRPPFRRLVRSPGTAASIAVLMVLIIQYAIWGIKNGMEQTWIKEHWVEELAASGWKMELANAFGVMKEVCGVAGVAILASWLILGLGRACRVRWDWVERFGVVLGLGWILILFEPVLTTILYVLDPKMHK
jgi:hypothetical protein